MRTKQECRVGRASWNSHILLFSCFLLFCLGFSSCGGIQPTGSSNSNGTPQPARLLYAVTDKGVSALRADNGQLQWSFPATIQLQPPSRDPAALVGSILVVATNDNLFGLDATTGKRLWQQPLKLGLAGDVQATSTLTYAVSDDGSLDAFDTHTGDLKWRSSSQDIPYATAQFTLWNDLVLVWPSPVNVTLGDEKTPVVALDRMSGAVKWQQDTPRLVGTDAESRDLSTLQTQLIQNTLLIGLHNGSILNTGPADTVVAVSASTGNVLWKISVAQIDSLVALDGTVYLLSKDHTGNEALTAYHLDTGTQAWNLQTEDTDALVQGGFLSAYQPTGAPLPWLAISQQGIFAAVGPSRGDIAALSPQDGHLLWKVPGTDSYQALFVGGGIVYAQSLHGTLSALQIRSQKRLWSIPLDAHARDIAMGINDVQFLEQTPYVFVTASPLDATGMFSALDPLTGRPRWSRQVPGTGMYELL